MGILKATEKASNTDSEGLRDVAQVLRDGGVGDRDPMLVGFTGYSAR